jgi:glycosyltransferase involved in cell wall biosynthesis
VIAIGKLIDNGYELGLEQMKIVYVNPVGALGGAERSLLDFLASLRKVDDSLDLHLITGTNGPLLAAAEDLGVRGEILPMPKYLVELGDSTLSLNGGTAIGKACSLAWRGFRGWLEARKYARKLKSRLQELAPDLIHSNGIKSHILTCMARVVGVPIVWHIHDFLSTRRVVGRALRWSSGRVAQAIANSRAVEADIHALLRGVRAKTIYYGIDTDYYAPGPAKGGRLDELAGLTPGGPEVLRVGLVATYARWKGQEVFLAAAAKLNDLERGRSVRFFVVGGPIYETQGSQYSEAELRALAASFVPFQNDTASVYRSLDVVVHASTNPEPFGRTIVEAMACGRATIAMQAGGAAELFTHKVDALGVPPNDPIALAAAMHAFTENSALRQSLGERARKNAVERFSRGRLGAELLTVYRHLLSSPGGHLN